MQNKYYTSAAGMPTASEYITQIILISWLRKKKKNNNEKPFKADRFVHNLFCGMWQVWQTSWQKESLAVK